MHKFLRVILSAIVLLLSHRIVSAQSTETPRNAVSTQNSNQGHQKESFDWPQWRGPRRDGLSLETGLLKRWPEGGPELVWKVKNLGGGYSSPSISQRFIVGMSYRPKQVPKKTENQIDSTSLESLEEVIWALDERTGKELWVKAIGPRGKAAYNDGPRSTPTLDKNHIYVMGISGDLVCLELQTGKILWRKSLQKEFQGKMMSNWGFSESPLVDGNRVVITPGSDLAALVALSKENGEVIWKSRIPDCGGAGYSSIMRMNLNSLPIYITWLGNQRDTQGKIIGGKGLVAVDAETGKFLWNYDRIANRTANIPTVIIHDTLVFCSNGYPQGGTAVLQCSRKENQVHIQELAYQPARVLQNHHGGMVAVQNYVYMGSGHRSGFPTCAELRTAKIVWKEDPGPSNGSANVISADGMLYFCYETGTIALIEANSERYHLVSHFTPDDLSGKPTWSHLAIANGRLYFRDQDRLYCYELKLKAKKTPESK